MRGMTFCEQPKSQKMQSQAELVGMVNRSVCTLHLFAYRWIAPNLLNALWSVVGSCLDFGLTLLVKINPTGHWYED